MGTVTARVSQADIGAVYLSGAISGNQRLKEKTTLRRRESAGERGEFVAVAGGCDRPVVISRHLLLAPEKAEAKPRAMRAPPETVRLARRRRKPEREPPAPVPPSHSQTPTPHPPVPA